MKTRLLALVVLLVAALSVLAGCAAPMARVQTLPTNMALIVEDPVFYKKFAGYPVFAPPLTAKEEDQINALSGKDVELVAKVAELFRQYMAAEGFEVLSNPDGRNTLRMTISIARQSFVMRRLLGQPSLLFLLQIYNGEQLVADYSFALNEPDWLISKETVLKEGIKAASYQIAKLLLNR